MRAELVVFTILFNVFYFNLVEVEMDAWIHGYEDMRMKRKKMCFYDIWNLKSKFWDL